MAAVRGQRAGACGRWVGLQQLQVATAAAVPHAHPPAALMSPMPPAWCRGPRRVPNPQRRLPRGRLWRICHRHLQGAGGVRPGAPAAALVEPWHPQAGAWRAGWHSVGSAQASALTHASASSPAPRAAPSGCRWASMCGSCQRRPGITGSRHRRAATAPMVRRRAALAQRGAPAAARRYCRCPPPPNPMPCCCFGGARLLCTTQLASLLPPAAWCRHEGSGPCHDGRHAPGEQQRHARRHVAAAGGGSSGGGSGAGCGAGRAVMPPSIICIRQLAGKPQNLLSLFTSQRATTHEGQLQRLRGAVG